MWLALTIYYVIVYTQQAGNNRQKLSLSVKLLRAYGIIVV